MADLLFSVPNNFNYDPTNEELDRILEGIFPVDAFRNEEDAKR
jgi:hypothetical protein